MTEILLLLITILLAAIAGFLIPTLLELRKTSRQLNEFIIRTEGTLKPVVEQLSDTLKEVKAFSEGANSITDDIKRFSSAVGDAGDRIKKIVEVMDEIPFKAHGIKAGIGAAFGYLIARFFKKKEEN